MEEVKTVFLSSSTYFACLTHALSAEREEVMGLLFGYFKGELCHVASSAVMQRLDKRPDRVEISNEDMAGAISTAEQLTKSEGGGQELTVVGWYHSHPHITVPPSAVDIRTQHQYQGMDGRFVGLIFGVFDTEKPEAGSGGKVSIIAFQSESAGGPYRKIPVDIVPSPANELMMKRSGLEAVLEIDRIVRKEENESYHHASKATSEIDLSRIHNSAVYVEKMLALLEKMTEPLHHMLASRKQACRSALH